MSGDVSLDRFQVGDQVRLKRPTGSALIGRIIWTGGLLEHRGGLCDVFWPGSGFTAYYADDLERLSVIERIVIALEETHTDRATGDVR